MASFQAINNTDVFEPTSRTKINLLVDNSVNKDGSVAFTGNQSMGSNRLTSVLDPTSAQDAATKNYVDTTVGALSTANATADQTGIAALTDLTNLSVTVTVPSGTTRKVRIAFATNWLSAAGKGVEMYIREGGTTLATFGLGLGVGATLGSDILTLSSFYTFTATAGSHTYKLSAAPTGVSVDLKASATRPSTLEVDLL